MPVVLLQGEHLQYQCPGCGWHSIPVKTGVKEPNSWLWNGDHEKPTISPSIKVTSPGWPANPEHGIEASAASCCHHHINNGIIEFCNDCTHSYNEKHVPLEPYSEAEVKMNMMEQSQCT